MTDADRILRLRRLATQPLDAPDGDAILVSWSPTMAEPATLRPNGDLIEPIGDTRDRLLTTSDGRQYVSRSYGPWEAVAAPVMDGQEVLPW